MEFRLEVAPNYNCKCSPDTRHQLPMADQPYPALTYPTHPPTYHPFIDRHPHWSSSINSMVHFFRNDWWAVVAAAVNNLWRNLSNVSTRTTTFNRRSRPDTTQQTRAHKRFSSGARSGSLAENHGNSSHKLTHSHTGAFKSPPNSLEETTPWKCHRVQSVNILVGFSAQFSMEFSSSSRSMNLILNLYVPFFFLSSFYCRFIVFNQNIIYSFILWRFLYIWINFLCLINDFYQ